MKRANFYLKKNDAMEQLPSLKIAGPVQKVEVLGDRHNEISNEHNSNRQNLEAEPVGTQQAGLNPNSGDQKSEISRLCQTLNGLVIRLNQFYDGLFTRHKEAIAKLSVEIARKVLVQKVQDGDYRIEEIVKEAITNAGSHKDIVVHLNPKDFEEYQKLQKEADSSALEGLELVPDSSIGAAQCRIESPKGTIESLIEQHLERIGKALENAE